MWRGAGTRRRLDADLCFAIPGDLATLTGGYGYDRRLIGELRRAGWKVAHLAAGAELSLSRCGRSGGGGRELRGVSPREAWCWWMGSPSAPCRRSPRQRPVVFASWRWSIIRWPRRRGSALRPSEALFHSERRALATTRGVIATSSTTAQRLIERYGVAPERLAVARPGSDPRIRRSDTDAGRRDEPVSLLSIGTLTPRKGHDLLIEALARLADLPWTCRIIGSPDRAPATAADLRARIARHGLQSRIILAGETADLSAAYGARMFLCLRAVTRAMGWSSPKRCCYGLPVIATTGGAIPEVVPPGAGILVPARRCRRSRRALAQWSATPRARALCRPVLAAPPRAAELGRPRGMSPLRWRFAVRMTACLLALSLRGMTEGRRVSHFLEKRQSNRTSPPSRCILTSGRSASSRRSIGGRSIPNGPAPTNNRTTQTCRRSSAPAERNAETVFAPHLRSGAGWKAVFCQRCPHDGVGVQLQPSRLSQLNCRHAGRPWQQRPSCTTNLRAPSSSNNRAVGSKRPVGSIATRAGFGPLTRRTVNRGSSASSGTRTHDHGIDK